MLNINTHTKVYSIYFYRYIGITSFKTQDWKDAHPIHDSTACGERIKDEERKEETSTMSSLFGIFFNNPVEANMSKYSYLKLFFRFFSK